MSTSEEEDTCQQVRRRIHVNKSQLAVCWANDGSEHGLDGVVVLEHLRLHVLDAQVLLLDLVLDLLQPRVQLVHLQEIRQVVFVRTLNTGLHN